MSERGLEPSANVEPSGNMEPSANIKSSSDGRWQVSGELSLKTVSGLVSKGRDLFNSNSNGSNDLNVDLSGVSRADSAGLALLIEWQRQAQGQNRSICFHNIPSQMLAIARLSGVDDLLSLA